jgi:hypothetical protein
MPIQQPILLEDSLKVIKNSRLWLRLKALLTQQVQKVVEESQGELP